MRARERVRQWRTGWLASWRGRPHWLRRAVWILLAAYAGYLLLGNLLLNTALQPLANRRPDAFQARWGTAFTLYPGHVVARDVRLQGQVRDLAWDVQAERVSGRVALWPLLRREVRVPAVVATGVGGGARHVERERAPPPPAAGGWTLFFERIASDSVRRGHFDELVLEGDGTATFGFSKQLRGGPLQVFESSVHFDGARVLAGGEPLLAGATLDGQLAIARHTRAQAPGMRKLPLTDGALTLDAETASLRGYTDPQGRFRVALAPGGGRVQARLAMDDGVLQPGGTLVWTAPLQGTGVAGGALDDSLRLEARVDQDIALRLQVPRREGGAFDMDADLRLQGRQLPVAGDLQSLLPRASGHLLGQWHFASLDWVPRMFNAPPWFELEGAGDLRADLRIENGRPLPGSHVELPDVAAAATVMDNRISGHGRVRADLAADADGALRTQLALHMDDYSIAASSAPFAPYAKGGNLVLEIALDGLPSRGGGLGASGARLRFADAIVPDLRVYNRFLSPHLRIEGGRGTASADLHLDAVGNIGQGVVSAQGHDARMYMAGHHLRGDVALDARLHLADLQQRQFDLDGSTVALRNVSFHDAQGRSRRGWWAEVDLPRARLELGAPHAFDGDVRVRASDVGFLLDLFGGDRDWPRWMDRLVDSGQAHARGRVRWQGDALVLDQVQAGNDRYEVLARLRLDDGDRRGQLFAQWGALSAGVDLRDGHRDLRLVGARQWFESQPALLH